MEGSESLAKSNVTNTYGNGEGNTTKHHYAGSLAKSKKKKCKKKKK